jgi:hypothetical protein
MNLDIWYKHQKQDWEWMGNYKLASWVLCVFFLSLLLANTTKWVQDQNTLLILCSVIHSAQESKPDYYFGTQSLW